MSEMYATKPTTPFKSTYEAPITLARNKNHRNLPYAANAFSTMVTTPDMNTSRLRWSTSISRRSSKSSFDAQPSTSVRSKTARPYSRSLLQFPLILEQTSSNRHGKPRLQGLQSKLRIDKYSSRLPFSTTDRLEERQHTFWVYEDVLRPFTSPSKTAETLVLDEQPDNNNELTQNIAGVGRFYPSYPITCKEIVPVVESKEHSAFSTAILRSVSNVDPQSQEEDDSVSDWMVINMHYFSSW